jgi:hypothetical protein
MIVAACNATLYLNACSSVLYSDSRTVRATAQKLTMILMNIALEKGFNAMVDA